MEEEMGYHAVKKSLAVLGAVVVFTCFGVVAGASAHTGEWAKFNYCPSTNPSAFKCLQSVTNGGKVVLGKKTVPIVNPVTLQGGLTEAEENEAGERFSRMIPATNGQTLTKAAQPVPGGLAGLVNCKEISNIIVRASCELAFENGLTGVNATLELAKPVNEVLVGQQNLAFEEGVGLVLPVRVHLENPFLGSGCYVGSSSSPLMWNLTTGVTAPPAGTAPLTGTAGIVEFIENAQILKLNNSRLVDNGWSAPHASGCGGFLIEYLVDPVIDSTVGLPSAAGKNVAQLENVNSVIALAEEVNNH
jgi:hypothetical protein